MNRIFKNMSFTLRQLGITQTAFSNSINSGYRYVVFIPEREEQSTQRIEQTR